MVFHQLYPWRDGTAFQAKLFGQFNARQALYRGKHRFGRSASGDAKVTIGPYLSIHAERGEFYPKLLIAHGFHPLFQVLHMFKISHLFRIPQADSTPQILTPTYPQHGGMRYAQHH